MASLIMCGGYEMNENQVRLLQEAIRLINRRSVDPERTPTQRMSYNSALTMILYAINENEENLAQFDDVNLRCEDCRRFESENYNDCSMCNACENHEFFEPRR